MPVVVGGIILDKSVHAEALRRRREVSSIETVPELLASLDSLSMAYQVESLKDAVCDYDENRATAGRLAELYLKQDIGGMYALSFQKVPRDHRHMDAFLEAMLFRRSARMAERLSPQFERGGAFVALGAMHLPGPRGLLRLLEARGLRVSAVDMDDPAQRPAAAEEEAPKRIQAGPDAPVLEADIPELLTAEQAAKVWELVKTLAEIPAGTPPPRIHFETFDPQIMSMAWLSWIDQWGKGHPDVALPFPKHMRGYYFAGTGVAQVAPAMFRKYYSADPATGMTRDFGGVGYYSIGHEMLHYAFELKGIPAEKHHCLFITSAQEGGSLSERLARSLSDSGLSNAALLDREALMSERMIDPCGARGSGPAAPRD